ncbi:MAG: BspA family leucine-rich repeat surface protein [Prevotella sp.]|nr:BspA family leucine-rich repeat surface protein [Prevotella sp.]
MPTMKAPGEETNEYGIIVTPGDGVAKVYNRSGMGYAVQGGQVYRVQQSGTVRIVECEDGTVYVLGIISNYGTDAYVKGVREGGTITIPTGQPVNYNGNYNATLSVYWVEYNQGFNKVAGESIVFDVDGNSIRLRDSNENRFIAVTWDDDDTFSGYGDYETVWVYDHDYVPPSVELIDVPAGLTTETWNVKGNDYQAGVLTSTCEVGFDGSDIYMKGIYSNFPNSWIKGTIANGTITFSGLQYLGETGDYHIWSTGYYDGALCDLVMDYDADAKVIKLSPGYYMVANASEDRLYYLQMFTDLTIQADAFVEHFSDPVMANWRQVDGKTYELQVAIEETDYRTNGDGAKFYKSLLTLDVVDEFGPQHVILDDGTIYSELPNGELHTCMLIDTNNNNIYVYALTKAADHYYGMDGFVYTASLSDLNFTKEEVFTSSNWGWYAYFMGPDSSGQPQLSHFSYSGYRDMLSTRSADGTWTTDYVGDISPDDFHSRSRDMRPVPVWGDAPDDEVEVDGAVYTIRDGQTAWLSWIDYKSMPVDYTVPATIMSAGQTYSVTGIAPAAFFGCTEMTRLTLPSSIEYIGETAFVETTRVLGELHVDAVTPPSVVSAFCFAGIDRSSCMLYVPDGSVNLYKSTPHWSEFQYPTAPASREPYAVLSNDNTVLTFYYDELKESRGGMGVGPFETSESRGWHGSREAITSLVFDASFADCSSITSTRLWFDGLKNLANITGLEYLNTSKVTDMGRMFQDCQSLTSLDMSHFDTSNVTNMERMFYWCSGLTSLDVSHFNTSNVTNMEAMFNVCTKLTSLDVSHFNTSKVTDMILMFYGCSSLSSLDVSHFDTSNVTDMSSMFSRCGSLSTLDVSHFNTSNVTNMEAMFNVCTKLTSLDVSHFDTSKVTDMILMFYGCSSLSSLDVSHFNTSKVTNMNGMFYGCSGLSSLDLSHFDTSNVTGMFYMFQGCSGVSSLDLSHFNTAKVTNMEWMFRNCTSLTTISVSDLWSTVSVIEGDDMFTGCTNLVGGNGTVYDENHTDYTYARIDREGQPGYLTGIDAPVIADPEPYAVLSNDNTVLTFYYDALKESRGGMGVGPFSSYEDRGWSESGGTITSVVFDASFADCTTITSTRYWFNGLWSLVNITGMEYLNTSNVADMSYMFGNCSSLSSINLNHFDTSSATDMAQMFAYCRSLTSLDLSIFNTSSVTSMAGMFYGCSSLASLDLSHFDTSSVTDMGELFYDCSSLTSIDLSHFNTSSVTSMAEMFRDCSSLTSIDMSHFDTSSVTDMGHMFTGCSNLSSLDLSHFDTSSVTTMWYMFRDCSSLTSLDLSHFNTSNVTAIQEMFGRCSSLTSLDLSHFNTSKVPRMYEMFQGCSNLVSLDLSSFDTSNVTDLHEMFQGCTSLTALDLSSFDTSLVTRTDEMFGDCSSLTTISVSDLWSTVSVTQGDGMFTGCTNLVGGNGTVYDANHTDHTYARIDREGEPGYLTGVNAKLSLPSPQMAFDYATGLLQLECDTPDVTILYNIGDSEPSQIYTTPLLLTDNRMVRFKAVADDFNDSEVLTFTPVPGGTMDEDGKTFRISGIVTANELVFVRNIMRQTIDHLDMTEALLQNDGLADEALADMRLLTFRSPKNVGTVGARMLKDNKRLAAVVWNAATDLTADAFEGSRNANMLLYVNNDALGANTGVHNRIVNQLAGDIVLSDTDDASTDGNFFAPEPFTARSISYSHVYKQTTGIDGECRGWETLSLPFDVQKVTHRLKGEVTPFGSIAPTLHFWLCKLGTMRFEHTTMIEANTPYIISMPKNDVYAAQYILADDTITFSAVDATIPATVLHTSTANAKTFVPSFMAQPAQDEIYTMNVSDPFEDHVEGSVFLPARRAVRPFEAFTTTEESGVRFITIFDDLPDTINDIQRSMFNVQHSSYDLLGRPWNGSRWLIENGKKTYRKRQK